MTTRAEIVAEARGWIGTPWIHQACCKGIGVDCIGLVAGVSANAGVPGAAEFLATADLRNYERQPNLTRLLETCDEYLERIEIAAAKLGDVLLIRFDVPRHFAIITSEDPLYAIHAPAGRVVEHRLDAIWQKRIMRAYHLPGVV